MTIRVKNGEFIVTRPSGGGTLFNVDDKLLHITNVVQGSQLIPQLAGGNSGGTSFPVDQTDYYDLGPVNAAATQIIGAVKFVLTGSGNGVAYNRWHMVMGGTIVWVMDGAPSLTDAGRLSNEGLSQYVAYHFEISAGRARMVRRAAINTAFFYVVQAHTIEYKLRAGVWV
jgi:hypothetical protein